MSDIPSGRPPRFLLPLLGLLVLVSGGMFFQSNWHPSRHSTSSEGVAIAAPAPSLKSGPTPKAATKAERTAAQKTIAAQLQAFNQGNWKEAVKFQSTSLKGNFASPEAFGEMIEKVYPAFVRPQKVTYGRSFNISGHIQFEVILTGEDGSVTNAMYSLVKEKGNYRVEGVMGGATTQPDENASMV